MNKRSDGEITGDIIAALAANPSIHANEIVVTLRDGLTRLQGSVDTLEEREAAEKIAARVTGVTLIENDLVISANKDVSDHDMTASLAEALAVDTELSGVGGRVTAGTAVLMGKVPSLALQQRAHEIARGVGGVRDVVSELEIAAGRPVDNITLGNDVAESISDDTAVVVTDMEVTAEDGLVHIRGEVESEREVLLITQRASAVPGVQRVLNLVRARSRS